MDFLLMMSFKINKCKVCTLVACVSVINITNFNVSSFKESVCNGLILLNLCSTGLTSQVSVYLGFVGLKLNTPLSSLLTRGWFPVLQPSMTMPSEERAALAVFTHS